MTTPSFLHLFLLQLIFPSSFAVDFVFNGFHDSDLYIFPGATIQSSILILTKATGSLPGRTLYKHQIPSKSSNYPSSPLPFFTSFIFSTLPVHSPFFFLSFILAPTPATTEHIPSVAFNHSDGAFQSQTLSVEFGISKYNLNDTYASYVCVNVNSLSSASNPSAGYTDPISGTYLGLTLSDGENYQAWIEYADFQLNVTVAPAGLRRPNKPLLSVKMNASDLLVNETYAGFFADTELGDTVRVLAWSFSNSNFSMHEGLKTSNLPSFSAAENSTCSLGGFIAGISIAGAILLGISVAVLLFFIRKAKRTRRKREQDTEEMEGWELEYWPHHIRFKQIFEATNGFSDSNMIGIGGNGKVYRAFLPGQIQVAVKCIGKERRDGMKEFLAEISTLGRLRHRNLVGLRGWCKRGTGDLMLVYDFMENGSLDKRIFDCSESLMLGWEARVRVLKDVAAGVLYLHEGWEVKVLHRDIKASNVMLDAEMRGKLGDFGLARVHSHARASVTTRVIGTVGYMAPEVLRGGKVSEKADVFGFGVLVLEVVCGRRPVEDGSKPLVESVRGSMEVGELVGAADARLKKGGLDEEEAEKLLRLGLWCASYDPHARPSMRQVVSAMDGKDGVASEGYWLGNLRWASSRWSKDELYASDTQPQPSSGCSHISDLVVEGR